MLRFAIAGFIAAVFLSLAAPRADAQRAGQSATVRTGTVSRKGSGRRDKNAGIGAVLGGAAAASKTRPGRVYTVTTNEGTMIQIATEQTELRVDDCVFVEEAGGSANIRRAPATACDPASQQVMQDAAIIEEMQEEASECAAAKQELVDADSDDAIDRAVRKVKLLCYD
jgi:hypothetical protein